MIANFFAPLGTTSGTLVIYTGWSGNWTASSLIDTSQSASSRIDKLAEQLGITRLPGMRFDDFERMVKRAAAEAYTRPLLATWAAGAPQARLQPSRVPTPRPRQRRPHARGYGQRS